MTGKGSTYYNYMNWLSIKRVFRAGFLDFWRNGFVSFASVLMMVFTLCVIGLAMFTGVILSSTLEEFRDKADMNVYFTTDAPEDRILEIKSSLEALPEVEAVTYMTREAALAAFRERHQNDQLTLQALEELGDNPLGAVLNIKAHEITQYEGLASFLNDQDALGSGATPIIEKINYYDAEHRAAVDRLAQITDSAKWIGLVVIVIFILMTIAISFNTLRLAIYSSRDEIQVMRLVGATKSYIRAPFMVEGVLYGLGLRRSSRSSLCTPLTWWLGSATVNFFGGVNVFSYFVTHFPLFFGVIAGSGVVLGAAASFLAVRRYLRYNYSMPKYIFVVGGVMSGIGKGIASSAIARIMKDKGLKVTALKIDPYINVDAGTMNPTEHGEVFVLDDGYETDQDMGNYERFLGETLSEVNYMTTAACTWR